MKKIIAILLSLALLLGCAAGLAEGAEKQSFGTIRVNGEFTLRGTLPEGYKVVPFEMSDDAILSLIVSDDPAKPEMALSIAYDETYSDVERLNDMDDEALATLEKTFTDTDPYANITYEETAYGTRLLISRTQSETYDDLDIFTIYKGYFVEFMVSPGKAAADQKITDDDVATCINFLSELDFVEGTETAEVSIEGKTFTANITAYDAAAKTIDADLLLPVTMTEWQVVSISEGDTIKIGTEDVEIATLKYEGDDAVINDQYYLRKNEDGLYNPFDYDYPIMEVAKTLTIDVPDTLVYKEDIDPASGELLDDSKILTAADLFSALEATKEDGSGFDRQNVSITFDEDGAATEIERYYAPWQ